MRTLQPMRLKPPRMSIGTKLLHMNWTFVVLLVMTASVGFAMLYSAANGNWDPWAARQMIRFSFGLGVMLVVAMIDVRLWLRHAYFFYLVSLILLVAVELGGFVGMGAQRWIDLGFVSLQPSEVMKIALILAMARYFHSATLEDVGRFTYLLPPIFMIAAPAALVLRQPDLGTAVMLIMAGVTLLFLVGVRMWIFVTGAVAALASIPLIWQFMREYQRQRVLTFINPENDPLGAGYHILQSKIALGSGEIFGKGFMQGTQSHLNFLPEKQTDFIFTMLAEEFGLVGGLGLLVLYALILTFGFAIALRCRNQFGRLLAMGITTTFFLYVFINIAMVMGLIPVVGVPLPLVSYGGTAMLTLLLGFGLLMSVYIHKDAVVGPRGAANEI